MFNGILLLFGNALIAFVEGLILSSKFGVRSRYAFPLMFVANYASSWIGFFTLHAVADVVRGAISLPIQGMLFAFIAVTLVSIPFAMLLESPLYWLSLRLRSNDDLRGRAGSSSIRANVMCNLITGIPLAGIILLQSGTSLATRLDERPTTAFVDSIAGSESVWVYFVSERNTVDRVRLDGRDRSTQVPVIELSPEAENDRYVRRLEWTEQVRLAASASGMPAESAATWDPSASIREDEVGALPSEFFVMNGDFVFDTTIPGTLGPERSVTLDDQHVLLELQLRRDGESPYIVVIDTQRGLLGHLARGFSPVVVREPADPEDPPPTLPVP